MTVLGSRRVIVLALASTALLLAPLAWWCAGCVRTIPQYRLVDGEPRSFVILSPQPQPAVIHALDVVAWWLACRAGRDGIATPPSIVDDLRSADRWFRERRPAPVAVIGWSQAHACFAVTADHHLYELSLAHDDEWAIASVHDL